MPKVKMLNLRGTIAWFLVWGHEPQYRYLHITSCGFMYTRDESKANKFLYIGHKLKIVVK